MLGRDDFILFAIERFNELPYGVSYRKKHGRPHGKGWGLLLYPAQPLPYWLNLFNKAKKGFFLFFVFIFSQNITFICVFNQRFSLVLIQPSRLRVSTNQSTAVFSLVSNFILCALHFYQQSCVVSCCVACCFAFAHCTKTSILSNCDFQIWPGGILLVPLAKRRRRMF